MRGRNWRQVGQDDEGDEGGKQSQANDHRSNSARLAPLRGSGANCCLGCGGLFDGHRPPAATHGEQPPYLDKDAKRLRPSPALMLLYNNVAELRQIRGAKTILLALSAAAAKHLNVEIADFLTQGVAVKPQEIGRPDLISAGGSQAAVSNGYSISRRMR